MSKITGLIKPVRRSLISEDCRVSSLRNERLKITSATVTFQVFKANSQTITFDAVVFKLPMPKKFQYIANLWRPEYVGELWLFISGARFSKLNKARKIFGNECKL